MPKKPISRSARASMLVSAAIRKGKLVRLPCEKCGNPKVQAHHDDYEKPLEVRWLCVPHHVERHKIRQLAGLGLSIGRQLLGDKPLSVAERAARKRAKAEVRQRTLDAAFADILRAESLAEIKKIANRAISELAL